MSPLDLLMDLDELNTHMEADPALTFNMAEMGFIKRVPFQQDHNGVTVSKWEWTEYGKKEMMERLNRGAEFQLRQGRQGKQ